MLVARLLWAAVGTYFLIGLALGVPLVTRWVERLDPGARGTSWAFRLAILPGAATFWPLLVRRCWAAAVGKSHLAADRSRATARGTEASP